jgi:SAM-dependent methyltransferase
MQVGKVYDFYKEHYADQNFQEIYRKKRLNHYIKMRDICRDLEVRSLLDVGCSYGLLVELCNEVGINAYGLDMPFETLKQAHELLNGSREKFIYGSVDDGITKSLPIKHFDALVIMDTLRHIFKPEHIVDLNANYLIIKEISDNRRNRVKAKDLIDRLQHPLYSPLRCLALFQKYYCYAIYPSKYLFKLNYPSKSILKIINLISPTYTLILKIKHTNL